MEETSTEKKSTGKRGRNTTSASARRRAAELSAAEQMIENLRNKRPSFAKTVEDCMKGGKRPVQLSPTLIVFSDKSKEELLERYKHTNNLF